MVAVAPEISRVPHPQAPRASARGASLRAAPRGRPELTCPEFLRGSPGPAPAASGPSAFRIWDSSRRNRRYMGSGATGRKMWGGRSSSYQTSPLNGTQRGASHPLCPPRPSHFLAHTRRPECCRLRGASGGRWTSRALLGFLAESRTACCSHAQP